MPGGTCPHGFPPGECLICRTLGTAPVPSATAPPASPARSGPARGVSVLPAHRSRPPIGLRLLGGAIVVAVTVLAVWWVVTLVAAVLHLVEVVAAGLVCGYLGFRLGAHHGRRHPR